MLGAIIEAVSGMSYESYMSAEVLQPLGLEHTSAGRAILQGGKEISQGYKPGLIGNREYQAPVYRGNTPAGYILSSAKDMASWLNLQMNPAAASSELRGPLPVRRFPMKRSGQQKPLRTRHLFVMAVAGLYLTKEIIPSFHTGAIIPISLLTSCLIQ